MGRLRPRRVRATRGQADKQCVTPGRAAGASVGFFIGASPSASSIVSSVSGVSSIPDAFALAWTCSGRDFFG